jgi:transposase
LIRVDAVWLAVEPLDMRAGTEAALRRVVAVFGAARPHHGYLFANRRANRMEVLVHDGIGVWLAARRLNAGRLVWPRDVTGTLSLSRTQFDALVLGLPWQHVGEAGVITLLEPRVHCGICRWSARRGAGSIVIADDLDTLDTQQLRDALRAARAEAAFKQAVIDKLIHENAIVKRLKFAAQSERFSAEQKSLWTRRWTATWQPSPPRLRRCSQVGSPASGNSLGARSCRHICRAAVLVAKCLDHLPLYRQEAIFERAGHAIARSTLAQCGRRVRRAAAAACGRVGCGTAARALSACRRDAGGHAQARQR